MISGVGFPSFLRSAMPAVLSNADPTTASRLIDLLSPRSAVVGSTAGDMSVRLTWAAPVALQLVALVHHNAQAGATFDLTVSNAGAVVFSSPATPFPSPTPFSGVRPLLLPSPVLATAVDVALHGNGVIPWQLGALEAAGWFDWSDVELEREIGVDSTAAVADQGYGVDHVMSQWSPRVVVGRRGYLPLAQLDGVCLDFQRQVGRHAPFVWCEDVSRFSSLAREAILVRNDTRPQMQTTGVDYGDFAFQLREHLG